MRNTHALFVAAAVLSLSCGRLHADGGSVRLSERKGDYRVTVFTSPTPLRAGPVDISVFIQDAATGEPIPQARITIYATPRDRPGQTICHLASTETATNKLFQAAVFDLPEAGGWDVTILVEGLRERIEVHCDLDTDEPLPRVGEMTPWIAWPAAVILLFCVHQWLVRRKKGRIPQMGTGPYHAVAQST